MSSLCTAAAAAILAPHLPRQDQHAARAAAIAALKLAGQTVPAIELGAVRTARQTIAECARLGGLLARHSDLYAGSRAVRVGLACEALAACKAAAEALLAGDHAAAKARTLAAEQAAEDSRQLLE